MSMKVSPPITTTERPALRAETIRGVSDQSRTATTDAQSSPTSAPTQAAEAVDTSRTAGLVEVGRHEADQLHNDLIMQLRDQIRSGTYAADLDVVAERVAEVLGAA